MWEDPPALGRLSALSETPPDRPGTPFDLALGHWGPATDPGRSRGPGGASLVCKLPALCTCSGGGLALPLRALLWVAQGHAGRCGSVCVGGVLTLGLPPSCRSPRPCSCSFSSNPNLSCPAQPSACQSCWDRGGRARWPVPGLTALRFSFQKAKNRTAPGPHTPLPGARPSGRRSAPRGDACAPTSITAAKTRSTARPRKGPAIRYAAEGVVLREIGHFHVLAGARSRWWSQELGQPGGLPVRL